ncbi:MAG: hypothetical protein U1E76_15470 [Planctomycetota bacterium]
MPAIQAIARLLLKSGRRDERLQETLDTIALRGETEAWREWAQHEMLPVGKR